MASSRRTGTNENVQTFGNGTRDFTTVQGWESLVDEDSTAAGNAVTEVLECYDDDSPYDLLTSIAGGTHDATYPLIKRAASGHENRGTRDSGVIFDFSTTSTRTLNCADEFFYSFDIGYTIELNTTLGREAVRMAAQDLIYGNMHVFNVRQLSTGLARGLIATNNADRSVFVNSMIVGTPTSDGMFMQGGAADMLVYNCTIRDADQEGINNDITGSTCIVKNTIVSNSGTTDYTGSYNSASVDNIASDTSAPGTSPLNSSTPTYVSTTDAHLDSTDTVANEAGSDLSSDGDFDFDDDIDGETRTVTWSAGAHELDGAAPAGQPVGAMMRMGVGR